MDLIQGAVVDSRPKLSRRAALLSVAGYLSPYPVKAPKLAPLSGRIAVLEFGHIDRKGGVRSRGLRLGRYGRPGLRFPIVELEAYRPTNELEVRLAGVLVSDVSPC